MEPHQQHPQYKTAPPLPGTGQQHVRPTHRPPYTEEVRAKHEESRRKYPHLSLSPEEYVIQEVRRHPIGLILIWLFAGALSFILLALVSLYGLNHDAIEASVAPGGLTLPSALTLFPLALFAIGFIAVGALVATIVYQGNRFYLTNEAVFQFLQTGLLTTKLQVINLINVEDASHDQAGLLQQLLNYGTLRLSTQGEETIYRFLFVAKPVRIVGLVNDAVENAIRVNQGLPPTEH